METALLMQIGLAVTGLTALGLTAVGRPPFVWYGCIVGLISQVFWFHTATHPWQPGLFALAIAYTIVFALGVVGHWPRRAQR